MSTQIERRWGILAIAVLMFFVTMVVTNINGAKTSFYYYIWMMVGYYAYKANLSSIKSMMKIVIFINIGVLALIIPFMDDTALGYLNSSSKFDLIVSVIVMLIPKTALYFYCKSQLERSYNFGKSDNFDAEEGPTEQTDDHWERAYKEVNGGDRVTAVWARAFSEADGDESKAKARYLPLRVQSIIDENKVLEISRKVNAASEKDKSSAIKKTEKYYRKGALGTTNKIYTCLNCDKKQNMLIKRRIASPIIWAVTILLGGFPGFFLGESLSALFGKNDLTIVLSPILTLASYIFTYFYLNRNTTFQCPTCGNLGDLV